MLKGIGWSTLFLLVICAIGCGKSSQVAEKAEEETKKPERVAIPVQVERPQRNSISAYFETTARVVAENRVEVISKGVGLCTMVGAEEGDAVTAGQVLAKLDEEELMTQLRQTQVNLEKSKTAFEIASKSLEEGIGSKVERDNARFALDAAKATLEAQQVQIKNQTIIAPINGVVTRRNIQQGMMVSTAMPVFSIADPSSYILPINPPEKELSRLSTGQKALVSIDSCQGQEFTAFVRRINPSVDPLSGTVKVTLDFDKEAGPCLREAAFARVRLIMETHENALLVPKDALLEDNARKYLMLVREQTSEEKAVAASEGLPASDRPIWVAERVEAQTGLEDSNSVEIISGITDQSQVVTLGQHTLKPGSDVFITDGTDALKPQDKPEDKPIAANTSAS